MPSEPAYQIHLLNHDGEELGDATKIDVTERPPARILAATLASGDELYGQILETHESTEDGMTHFWISIYAT